MLPMTPPYTFGSDGRSSETSCSSASSLLFHPSSSRPGWSDRKPKPVPSASVGVVALQSLFFSNLSEQERWLDVAQVKAAAVFQIKTPTGLGSGFLIAKNLLMTCHHILHSPEEARVSKAFSFRVLPHDISGRGRTLRIEELAFNPDEFFYTSPVGEQYAVDEKHLDFTVIALETHPYLSMIEGTAFSIFEDVPLIEQSPICVLHYPDCIDATTTLRGVLSCNSGTVMKRSGCVIDYDAMTEKGSSGGAVMDANGKLIAIHRHTNRERARGDIHAKSNSGVSMLRIAAALAEQRARIESSSLPPSFASTSSSASPSAIISGDLPGENLDFTGREKELAQLGILVRNHRQVAVNGLGGMGKSTLITQYANHNPQGFRRIHYIPQGQIEAGFLDLAEELGVTGNTPDQRLRAVKRKLEQEEAGVLLIVEGIDDQETFNSLFSLLPSRGRANILLSTRLEGLPKPFVHLLVDKFSKNEAIDFLIKATNGKDSNRKEASKLARELGYLPLALSHAAAVIGNCPDYTFRRYYEDLRRLGPQLLGRRVLSLGKQEEAVLKTWNRTLEAIKALEAGPLAISIFHFLTVFDFTIIPAAIVEANFREVEEIDYQIALGNLKRYSLIQHPVKGIFIHPLLQKITVNTIDPKEAQHLRLKALTIIRDIILEKERSAEIKNIEIITNRFVSRQYANKKIGPSFGIIAEIHQINFLREYIGLLTMNSRYYEDARKIIKIQNEKKYPAVYHAKFIINNINVPESTDDLSKIEKCISVLHNYHLSEQRFQSTIDLCQFNIGLIRRVGASSLDMVQAKRALAEVYYLAKDYENFVRCLEEILADAYQLENIDSLKFVETWLELGTAYLMARKFDNAYRYLKTVLYFLDCLLDKSIDPKNYRIDESIQAAQRAKRDPTRFIAFQQDRPHWDNRFPQCAMSTYISLVKLTSELGLEEERNQFREEAICLLETTSKSRHLQEEMALFKYVFMANIGRMSLSEAKEYLNELERITSSNVSDHSDSFGSYGWLGIEAWKGYLLLHCELYGQALTVLISTMRGIDNEMNHHHSSPFGFLAQGYVSAGMGLAHFGLANFEEALKCFEKAELCGAILELPGLVKLESPVQSLTKTYRALGQYQEALKYAMQYLELCEESVGSQHPDYAAALDELAVTKACIGDVTRAIRDCRKAEAIRERCTNVTPRQRIEGYHSSGYVYRQAEKWDEALEYLTKAISLHLKMFGPDRQLLGNIYFDLGAMYEDKKEFNEALSYHRKAMDMRERLLGVEHPYFQDSQKKVSELSALVSLFPALRESSSGPPSSAPQESGELVEACDLATSI